MSDVFGDNDSFFALGYLNNLDVSDTSEIHVMDDMPYVV